MAWILWSSLQPGFLIFHLYAKYRRRPVTKSRPREIIKATTMIHRRTNFKRKKLTRITWLAQRQGNPGKNTVHPPNAIALRIVLVQWCEEKGKRIFMNFKCEVYQFESKPFLLRSSMDLPFYEGNDMLSNDCAYLASTRFHFFAFSAHYLIHFA